jgi:hypothetical protein
MTTAIPQLRPLPASFAALEDPPLSPDEEALCTQREEELRSGRVQGVPHAEVRREIERRLRGA